MSNILNEVKIDELIYFVFGIKYGDTLNDKDALKACANRAYLDMCRTLRFNDES